MIATLGLFGAAIFDSSSFFAQARHRDRIEPETFCHFNKPLGKPACKLCMSHPPRGVRPTSAIAAANVLEIMKEVTRLRCAMDEKVENDYLNVKVGTNKHDAMSKIPGVSKLRWFRSTR